MADKSLLKVYLIKQIGVLQLLPRSPVISSEEARWSNLLVQHHQQPAWEMPENTLAQHVIAIHFYPTQEVQGFLFGIGQLQAHEWEHKLTPNAESGVGV